MPKLINLGQARQMTEEQILDNIAAKKEELAPDVRAMVDLELYLKNRVLELGENIETVAGKCEIIPAVAKYEWDMVGLEGYAKEHPEVLTFKKLVEVNTLVKVTYK